MRFARYWVSDETGAVLAVLEQETPFDGGEFVFRNEDDTVHPATAHELGMVSDFKPVDLEGAPCNPASHLYLRLNHHPERGAQPKPGHTLPRIHDCPATMDAIRKRLRARGPAGLPLVARAWLTHMLSDHQVRALGVAKGVTAAHLKAFDALRARRDPHVGTRAAKLERHVQEQSDVRVAAQLARRNAPGETPLPPPVIATGSAVDRDAILAMVAQALEQKGG